MIPFVVFLLIHSLFGTMSNIPPTRTRKESSMSSTSGTSNSSKNELLDREGNIITSVGTTSCFPVPIDLLQSLYLGRRPSVQASESSSSLHSEIPAPIPAWPQSVTFTSTVTFPAVKKLASKEKKKILVTGGAGFLGSHLVDRLLLMGHDVIVLDNFYSGSKSNLSSWLGHPNFELVRADVVEPVLLEVQEIYHLACPASPKSYQANSIKTLKTNFNGTLNMLGKFY